MRGMARTTSHKRRLPRRLMGTLCRLAPGFVLNVYDNEPWRQTSGKLMANALPLDRMSVEEKIQAMESLWDDLCNRAGGVVSPAWHENVLAERDAAHKRGEDE